MVSMLNKSQSSTVHPSFPRNVKVIAFGKAVLGMVSAVEDVVGSHITEGIASVPVGSLEVARQAFPKCVPKEGSNVRYAG